MIRLIKLIYIALLLPASVFAAEIENDIKQQVSDYVLNQIQAEPSDKVEAIANAIDKRLNLTQCKIPLEITITGTGEIRRNTTADVTCPDTPGWHLFVPVKIRIQKPVVVAATPISKGSVLSADSLTISYIDSFMLNGDMTTDINVLIGARSKRDLKTNQPLRLNQICIVCRDDSVEIIAEKGGMQIKTNGRALQDGSLNDRIRVQNVRSQRIISAVVSGVGQVKIEM
jgi:flagellar basal body P-ring formation protein FlgA